MLRFDLMPRARYQYGTGSACVKPNVDIAENKDAYELVFEIPGIAKTDVKIWVENDLLVVSGEKKLEKSENETRHMSERRYGKFERSFWIPEDTDREKIKANFENGLLTVSIPKTEKAKPKEIEIQVQ